MVYISFVTQNSCKREKILKIFIWTDLFSAWRSIFVDCVMLDGKMSSNIIFFSNSRQIFIVFTSLNTMLRKCRMEWELLQRMRASDDVLDQALCGEML